MDESSRPTAPADEVAEFGRSAQRVLGIRPTDEDLAAALGAVSFKEKQTGSKLSPVVQAPRRGDGSRTGPRAVAPPFCSVTYASFATCPRSCVFLRDPTTGERRGCFVAGNGFMLRMMRRLDASAVRITNTRLRGTLIGLAEAFVIDRAFPSGVPQDGPGGGGRILRLHVAGDVANAVVARALALAVERWHARGGGLVWSYTHRWRTIARSDWGRTSIFASVETEAAALQAMALGYAAAIVVDAFAAPKAYPLADGDARILPCPHDVERVHADGRRITCATCGWCLSADRLLARRMVIGFAAGGSQDAPARRSVGAVRVADRIVRTRLVVLPDTSDGAATLAEPSRSSERDVPSPSSRAPTNGSKGL